MKPIPFHFAGKRWNNTQDFINDFFRVMKSQGFQLNTRGEMEFNWLVGVKAFCKNREISPLAFGSEFKKHFSAGKYRSLWDDRRDELLDHPPKPTLPTKRSEPYKPRKPIPIASNPRFKRNPK